MQYIFEICCITEERFCYRHYIHTTGIFVEEIYLVVFPVIFIVPVYHS